MSGFFTIATRNPASHIGVSVLGEALKDRFVWIRLDYQTEDEERGIVKVHTSCTDDAMISAAVKITRATRKNKDIRRGSSIRGAIDMVAMLMNAGADPWADQQLWIDVAISALVTKIDVEEGIDKSPEEIITLLARAVLTKDFFR